MNLRDLTIRKYLTSDRESCRSLWKELTVWHRLIYEDHSIGGSHPEDDFDKHLTKVGADHLWVAILDSKIVGLSGLMVSENEAEIEPLIISEPYRNKGIGKRLVEEVLDEVHRLCVRFLTVKPVTRNIEALRFFHKQGFKNLGHIELFIDLKDQLWKKQLNLFDLDFSY